jgi:hypothetical protein
MAFVVLVVGENFYTSGPTDVSTGTGFALPSGPVWYAMLYKFSLSAMTVMN